MLYQNFDNVATILGPDVENQPNHKPTCLQWPPLYEKKCGPLRGRQLYREQLKRKYRWGITVAADHYTEVTTIQR